MLTALLRITIALLAGPVLIFAGAQRVAGQEPGVREREIVLGNTMPYTGPLAAFGTVGRTIAAYLKKVNAEENGVNGRIISFITYDDASNPSAAVEMVRRLTERDKVFFIFAPFGTVQALAMQPYLNQMKIPQLFVISGSGQFARPKESPWSIGWQPTYFSEGKIYGLYLRTKQREGKIAVLAPEGTWGDEYVEGFRIGLGGAALGRIVQTETYQPGSLHVDSLVTKLKASGAQIFLHVGDAATAAVIGAAMSKVGWRPTHLVNSSLSSLSGFPKSGSSLVEKGALGLSFLKDPGDRAWVNDPGQKEWLAFMQKYYPDGDPQNIWNVYAYSIAQTVVNVLRAAGREVTREKVMRQAASLKGVSLPMLLPGIRLQTSESDFQPIKQAQLIEFDGDHWRIVGPVFDAAGDCCACKDGRCQAECCARSEH